MVEHKRIWCRLSYPDFAIFNHLNWNWSKWVPKNSGWGPSKLYQREYHTKNMSHGARNPSLLENTFYNTVNFVPGFKVTINPRTWQSLTITKPKFLRRFWILWFWQVWDLVLDNLNQISKINFLSKKWNSLQPCLSSTDLVYELRRSIPRSGPRERPNVGPIRCGPRTP